MHFSVFICSVMTHQHLQNCFADKSNLTGLSTHCLLAQYSMLYNSHLFPVVVFSHFHRSSSVYVMFHAENRASVHCSTTLHNPNTEEGKKWIHTA